MAGDLDSFLQGVGELLAHLPCSLQTTVYGDTVLNYVASHGPLLRKTEIPQVCFNSVGNFLRNLPELTGDNDSEEWVVCLNLFSQLSRCSRERFDVRRIVAQLNAVFDALEGLIIGATKLKSEAAAHSRRSDIYDAVDELFVSERSVVRMALTEIDPTVQSAVRKGWAKILQHPASMKVLLHPVLVPGLARFLVPPFKPIWPTIFTILADVLSSLSPALVDLFEHIEEPMAHVPLRAAILRIVPDRTDATSAKLFKKLSAKKKPDFAKFVRYITGFFWERSPEYSTITATLLATLRDNEKPLEPMEDETPTEAVVHTKKKKDARAVGRAVTLSKSQEKALLKIPIETALKAFVQTFGMKVIFQGEFDLSMVDKVSLRDTHFVVKSNAWLLPLLPSLIKSDEFTYFSTTVLPLIDRLKQKRKICSGLSEGSPSTTVQETELKLLERLMVQLWDTLPSCVADSIDFPSAIELSIERLNAELFSSDPGNGCLSVCRFLKVLAEQGISATQKKVATVTDEENDESTRAPSPTPYSDISARTAGVGSLQNICNKFMSSVVVRFVQAHRPVGLVQRTDLSESRVAALLTEVLPKLGSLCEAAFLEANLDRFNATWTEAVAAAASSKKANLPLGPADYGALVDVAVFLVPNLPEAKVHQLFSVFLTLLHDASVGLTQLKVRASDSGKAGPIRLSGASAAEAPRITLQCLVRRAFAGLRHVLDRIIESLEGDSEAPLPSVLLSPESLDNVWTAVQAGENRRWAPKQRTVFIRRWLDVLVLLSHRRSTVSDNSKNSEVNDDICFATSAKPPSLTDQVVGRILPEIIPEILWDLTEGNKTVRSECVKIIQVIGKIDGLSLDGFLQLLLPGLAAETSSMQASTIFTLSLLMRDFPTEISEELSRRISGIILKLLSAPTSPKISKACILYLRAYQRTLQGQDVVELVQKYLPLLSQDASKFRLSTRNLLDKAVKKVGCEAINATLPADLHPLVRYVERMQRRRVSRSHRVHNVAASLSDSE